MQHHLNEKILIIPDLKSIKRKSTNQTMSRGTVACYGVFNVLHPGHFRYLSWAKKQGNSLNVILSSDHQLENAKGHLDFPIEERAESLAAIEDVSKVIISYYENLENIIKYIMPELIVLGKEYQKERAAEVKEAIKVINGYGGRVLYHSGETNYSNSILGVTNNSREERLRISNFLEACTKQGFNSRNLLEKVNTFKNSSILVIGDTIVDQYVACDAIGMSAEAPVIVVKELETKKYIGGAAIVAAHIKALGGSCKFISVIGEDEESKFIKDSL